VAVSRTLAPPKADTCRELGRTLDRGRVVLMMVTPAPLPIIKASMNPISVRLAMLKIEVISKIVRRVGQRDRE